MSNGNGIGRPSRAEQRIKLMDRLERALDARRQSELEIENVARDWSAYFATLDNAPPVPEMPLAKKRRKRRMKSK